MNKQYKVDFYQTVYLGSQIVEAEDRKEAISNAEDMNWKAGIGLKWTDDFDAKIDTDHDYTFICTSHSKAECDDDECNEEYWNTMEEE